jgi:hypothetical protein
MSVRDTISRFLDGSFQAKAAALARLQGISLVEIARGVYDTLAFPDVSVRSEGVTAHSGLRTTTDPTTDRFGNSYSTLTDSGSELTCSAGSPNVSGPLGHFGGLVEGDLFYIQGDPTEYTVATKTDNENLVLNTNVGVTHSGDGVWQSATVGVVVEMFITMGAFEPMASLVSQLWPNLVVQLAIDSAPTGGVRLLQWNATGTPTDMYARADLNQLLYKLDGFSNSTKHWALVEMDPLFETTNGGLEVRFVRKSSLGSRSVLASLDSAASGPVVLTPESALEPYAYGYHLELFVDTADMVDIDSPAVGYEAPDSINGVRLKFRMFAST